jgi:CheY-like chemotaxis protein
MRQPSRRTLRILLVEDHADIADFIRMQLEMWGHEVAVAADGPAGLAAALRLPPDIALLDVGLPGMDGYELAVRIRQEIPSAAVRLVAMTGYGRPEDRARAAAAGFDAHLVKPVDPSDLRGIVEAEAVSAP